VKRQLANRLFEALSSTGLRLWHADYDSSPARQFILGHLRLELQIEALSLALLVRRLVEEVDDVSSEAIFGAAAFVEIEGARGIHFDIGLFAQDGAQLALKCQRSLAYLRHGEGDDVIGHSDRVIIAIGPSGDRVIWSSKIAF